MLGSGASYTISGAVKTGKYCCTVSDGIIQENVWFQVKVDSGLYATSNCGRYMPGYSNGKGKIWDVDVYGNNRVTLSVSASTSLSTLSYQWERFDKDENWWVEIPGATTSRYRVELGYGEYCCVISDGCNEIAIEFLVDSNYDTLFLSYYMSDQYFTADENGVLTVEAVSLPGHGTVSYQWYNDTNNQHELLAGATGASYTIPSGTMSSGTLYRYSCEVSNQTQMKEVDFYCEIVDVRDGGQISGNSVQVSATDRDYNLTRYQFVPEESAIYRVYADSNDDIIAILYDAQGNRIGFDYDDFVITHYLQAGQTYYLVTGYLYSQPVYEVYTVTFSKDGETQHEHKGLLLSQTDAVCTGGTMTYFCKSCGEVYEVNIPGEGHRFGAWTVLQEPTEQTEGKRARTCGVCGYTETEILAKLPPSGNSGGAVCTAHTFGTWIVTQEATVLAEDVRTRTCTVCGQTESETVAKLTPTLTLNVKTIPLKMKQSTTKVKVSGLAKGDSVVSWKSNKPKVVKVNGSGKLTAGKKTGTAKVMVKLASGLTGTVTVKVQKNEVATKSIKGIPKKTVLKQKGKLALQPELSPITSADKVTYTSSDTKVATVSAKGVVKAKKKGKATITVKAGKKTVKCKITVK